MVLRKSYLDKIIPFIDQDLIKVLVGIRRCGKTVLLGQIKDVFLQRNIPAQNIIQANFESVFFIKMVWRRVMLRLLWTA